MSVPVSFFSAVIKKSAVRKLYDGGEERFRGDYPFAGEDHQLFNIGCMSGGEFGEIVDDLVKAGLDYDNSFALGEMNFGESKPCPGIQFEKVSGGIFPRWSARLTSDSPEVMAAEGAKLYAEILKRGWIFDIPNV